MTTNEELDIYVKKYLPKNYHYINSMPSDVFEQTKFKLNDCTIVNYDTSRKEGSHWIAVMFPKDYDAEYSDSFGQKPDADDAILRDKTNFKKVLKKYSSTGEYTYNNLKLQDLKTSVCGCYASLTIRHGLPNVKNEFWKRIIMMYQPQRDLKIANIFLDGLGNSTKY